MSGIVQHAVNDSPQEWDVDQNRLQASFLQSGPWAAFQRQLGHDVHFISGDGWSCLLIERRTPLGRYLFAPYGPTLRTPAALKNCLENLKSYAGRAGADWLTIEPMLSGRGSQELSKPLAALGGRQVGSREPDVTRLVDLEPAPEAILAAISQSTRSFIRKSQRENLLSFKTSTKPEDIAVFIEMLKHVTDRKKVFFFNDEYFQKQARVLMPAGMLRLELALSGSQPVASALFHDYGEFSSYTFAASLPQARQTNASALLVWQAMLNAKQRGQKTMDLFGIAPEDAPPSHPWRGFSSFKQKFGGQVAAYAGTWDFPHSPRYRLYRAAKRLRAGL